LDIHNTIRLPSVARYEGFRAKHAPEPWPLAGLDTSPAAGRMAEEWDLLGFATGAPQDEHGLVEAALPAGAEMPGEAELVQVEGTVEVQYGALLRAARVSRVLPGPPAVAGQVGAVAAA
jgi:hypothetical protein